MGQPGGSFEGSRRADLVCQVLVGRAKVGDTEDTEGQRMARRSRECRKGTEGRDKLCPYICCCRLEQELDAAGEASRAGRAENGRKDTEGRDELCPYIWCRCI
jgi:hypothetical protein